MCVVYVINKIMSYYIDSEQSLIFIHIPKTAGSSIMHYALSQATLHHIPNDRSINHNYHSTLQDVENYLCPYNSNFFTFSVVRNPWDRAASWFFFRKEILRKGLKALSKNKKTSKVRNDYNGVLKEYKLLESNNFKSWLYTYYDQVWDNTWFSLSTPQNYWLKSNIFNVDKIIKFENLKTEIKKIDFFKKDNLPIVNVNLQRQLLKKYNYQDLYNDKSKKFLHRLCEEDIDIFKYQF